MLNFVNSYSKLSLSPTENISTYSGGPRTPVLKNNAVIEITNTRQAEMMGRVIPTAEVSWKRQHLRGAMIFKFSAKCV